MSQKVTISVVPAPHITSFTATPTTISYGSNATLTAVYENGSAWGSIPAIGNIVSGGPGVSTGPLFQPTTFFLNVTNAAGDVATASVVVAVDSFENIGSSAVWDFASATLLSNGGVLFAGGGGDSTNTTTAAATFLFDPLSGSFTPQSPMTVARRSHTATLLPNGKILFAGGSNTSGYNGGVVNLNSAEEYDTSTGSVATTGSMFTTRLYHTATLLPSGLVLVVGGANGTTTPAVAELYNPASKVFTKTGSMGAARGSGPSATLLPNGKVLIVGGWSGSATLTNLQAELYDPATGFFTTTGSTTVPRAYHSATLLPNGKVLIAGGDIVGAMGYTASAELYDPSSGTFTATGSMTTARIKFMATLLLDGRVLITGGLSNTPGPVGISELYDPSTGIFAASAPMHTARWAHTATLLANGKVLIVGGSTNVGSQAGAEMFVP